MAAAQRVPGMERMVSSLRDGGYVRSQRVYDAMCAVDRALFLPSELRDHAYMDQPIKFGNAHHSAVQMYAIALTELDLNPGDTFLNVGSGTGFLSTMAGLLLAGPEGTATDGCNHGIEIAESNVELASRAVEQFELGHPDLPFLRPHIVCSNAFRLDSRRNRLYSKIYVGAGATERECEFFLRFLDHHGVLVSPVGNEFRTITRSYDGHDSRRIFGGVAFAPLIGSEEMDHEAGIDDSRDGSDAEEGQTAMHPRPERLLLACRQPESLQKLVRSSIRRLIGPDVEYRIHALPLPEALKRYLNFGFPYERPEEEFPETPPDDWPVDHFCSALQQLLDLARGNIALERPKRAALNYAKAIRYLESPLSAKLDSELHAGFLSSCLLHRCECLLQQPGGEAWTAQVISDTDRLLRDDRFPTQVKAMALVCRSKARKTLAESAEDLEQAEAMLDDSVPNDVREKVQQEAAVVRTRRIRLEQERTMMLHLLQMIGQPAFQDGEEDSMSDEDEDEDENEGEENEGGGIGDDAI